MHSFLNKFTKIPTAAAANFPWAHSEGGEESGGGCWGCWAELEQQDVGVFTGCSSGEFMPAAQPRYPGRNCTFAGW
jgi:hypothetical protein